MNPISSAMQPFIFGAGTENPTYASLQRRRKIADMLSEQATGQTPRNMWEGISAVGKALLGNVVESKLRPDEDAERSRISDILGGLGGGPVAGAPGGFTGQGFSGTPSTYRDAIAGIESKGSGDYAAVGPDVKGDRAYGRYQVMGANIPDWTQEALGQAMTPQQFLANPQAQDATFDHRFGGYVDKYGPEGAAKAWFSGEGGMDNPDASDGNLTNEQYAAKFMGGLGMPGGGADLLGMAGMGQPDMGRLSQLAEVAGNPYASDGQKLVAQALIQREIGKGSGDALGWARLGLDERKFAQGTREGPKYYGSVQWAQQPNPDTGEMETFPYQIGTDGTVNRIDLGGAQPLPPTKSADLGTAIAQVGPGGMQTGQTLQKDVAGAAAQKAVGETQAAAAAGLPARAEALNRIRTAGQEIINDPVLPEILGNIQGRLPPRSQAQADAQAKIDRFLGQTFPMAMDSLRGLGPASEREGIAAQAAIANLAQTQSPEAFIAAINEAIGHIERGYAIAEQQAQGNVLPGPSDVPEGIDPEDWKYLPDEMKKLWVR